MFYLNTKINIEYKNNKACELKGKLDQNLKMLAIKKRKLAPEYFNLHDDGYVVYKRAFNITSEIFKNIKLQAKNMSGYIFNGKKHNDKKRLQKKLSTKNLDELFSEIRFFISENVNSILSQQNPVILKSLPGCERQLPHTDYIPDEDLTNILNKNDNEKIPLLMLVSIMPGTKICIWPKSINLIHKTTDEKLYI
jgi:hypothetical protein